MIDATSDVRRRHTTRFIAATLVLFVLLFARAMSRDLDPDEHQFVAPPALLAHFHLLPYRDYPYFHMPDLVLLLAGLTGWTSWKLLAARTVSVLCGTATIALLFAAGWNRLIHLPPRSRWAIAGGVCVIFFNGRLFTYTDGWAWNHDSAVLCAVGAVLLYQRGVRTNQLATFAAAGLLAGLAIGIRLSFALLPIALAIDLLCNPLSLGERAGVRVGLTEDDTLHVRNRPHPNPLPEGEGTASPSAGWWRRLAMLGVATAAALLALSPAIYLAFLAPRAFWFGNLGYPALSTAYYRTWDSHGMTFITKIGQTLQKFLTDPADAALGMAFVASLIHLHQSRRLGRRVRLLLGVLFALWIGVMGPTPIQPQYNYMLLPFMVLVIFEGIAAVPRIEPWTKVALVAALVLGTIGLPRWYWGILRLPTPGRWTPVQRHHLAEWVRAQTGPSARVLTIEPAIPLEAGLAIYPQYAVGRFVLLVTPYQTPQKRQKTGMMGTREIAAVLAHSPPDAILIQHVPPKDQIDRSFISYARQNRYRRLVAPDGIHELWVRSGLGI